MRTYGVIAILCCLTTAGLAPGAAGDSFRVTQLPEWQGRTLKPHAMNDRGRVVGVVRTPEGPSRLFLWDRVNGVQDLGQALPEPSDINNKGQIVATMSGSEGHARAFLREPDGRVEFLGPANRTSEARAINDHGQVVGQVFIPIPGVYHAFVWDRAGGMRELTTTRGTPAAATAISDTGQVFGHIQYHEGVRLQRRPYYWELTEPTGAVTVDVPGSNFFSMNGRGWVVGKYAFLSGGAYAVLWHSKGGIEKLFPYGMDDDAFVPLTCRVNDANQVVCIEEKRGPWPVRVDTVGTPERRRYLWDRARGRISFDEYLPDRTCEFTLCDLNNRGCILGIAHLEDADHDVPLLLEPEFAKNEVHPDSESSELELARGL